MDRTMHKFRKLVAATAIGATLTLLGATPALADTTRVQTCQNLLPPGAVYSITVCAKTLEGSVLGVTDNHFFANVAWMPGPQGWFNLETVYVDYVLIKKGATTLERIDPDQGYPVNNGESHLDTPRWNHSPQCTTAVNLVSVARVKVKQGDHVWSQFYTITTPTYNTGPC